MVAKANFVVSTLYKTQKMSLITGKIIDKYTGNPIDDAVVTLNRITDTSKDIAQITNKMGTFVWDDITNGDYEIKIFKDGYKVKLVHYKCMKKSLNDLTVMIEKLQKF